MIRAKMKRYGGYFCPVPEGAVPVVPGWKRCKIKEIVDIKSRDFSTDSVGWADLYKKWKAI